MLASYPLRNVKNLIITGLTCAKAYLFYLFVNGIRKRTSMKDAILIFLKSISREDNYIEQNPGQQAIERISNF